MCASLNVKLCILKNHSAGEGMKFGQLILRRIVKIVATKCQILRPKCTKKGGEGEREGKKGREGKGGKERRGEDPRVYL